MKYIKRMAACILSAAVCASLLTACADSSSKRTESTESSASKSKTMHTLYVRDEFKSKEDTPGDLQYAFKCAAGIKI